MKNKIISLLEGKKRKTNYVFPNYEHELYNLGINTAIESVDEIMEMIIKEIDENSNYTNEYGYVHKIPNYEKIINKLKE